MVNGMTSIPQAQASGTTSDTTSSSSSKSSSTDFNSMFLTLLATELKAQDPTAPMDTSEMVSQLVSINQLNEVMQIRALVEKSSDSSSTTSKESV